MPKNALLITLLLAIAVLPGVGAIQIATLDFLMQPTFTNAFLWFNFVGLNLYMDEILPYWNTTNFQGFMRNSNLNGNWANNFPLNIKMPKGWFFNCTAANAVNNGVACGKELEGNTTFWEELGEFVWNTCNQPYWTFSLNNEKLNLFASPLMQSIYKLMFRIYSSTHQAFFFMEMATQADLAVANGMRIGNYTLNTFLEEAYQYEEIIYGIPYRAPGISVHASQEWLGSIDAYFKKVWIGVFTMEAVIFPDPAACTISNLLKDDYTKGYIQRRATVNGSFAYGTFSDTQVSFSSVKLLEGDGIDGVTNSFAAAIWYVDFYLECALFGFFDFYYEGHIYANNYQGVLGPGPTFQPSAIYYGMIFSALIGDGIPKIVIPQVTSGSSSKIKAWGMETDSIFKLVILNKDENATMSGRVTALVQSKEGTKMKCIYMKAPSLTSKGEDITIGGYAYGINGSSAPVGSYAQTQLNYNSAIGGYEVPLRYAEVCVCEIPNINKIIPTGDCHESWKTAVIVGTLLLGLLM